MIGGMAGTTGGENVKEPDIAELLLSRQTLSTPVVPNGGETPHQYTS